MVEKTYKNLHTFLLSKKKVVENVQTVVFINCLVVHHLFERVSSY